MTDAEKQTMGEILLGFCESLEWVTLREMEHGEWSLTIDGSLRILPEEAKVLQAAGVQVLDL